jgi:hypothetical protein
MCGKVFIKRVIPFFLTFAVGLFIASFFVSIALPNVKISNRGWRRHQQHQQYHQMMELEKNRLKEENVRLKMQLQEKSLQDLNDSDEADFAVPPPPPMAPMPPTVKARTIPYNGK